jgi:hypothetical protein
MGGWDKYEGVEEDQRRSRSQDIMYDESSSPGKHDMQAGRRERERMGWGWGWGDGWLKRLGG